MKKRSISRLKKKPKEAQAPEKLILHQSDLKTRKHILRNKSMYGRVKRKELKEKLNTPQQSHSQILYRNLTLLNKVSGTTKLVLCCPRIKTRTQIPKKKKSDRRTDLAQTTSGGNVRPASNPKYAKGRKQTKRSIPSKTCCRFVKSAETYATRLSAKA